MTSIALLLTLFAYSQAASADTVCELDVLGHGARVVLTDRELEVDGDPVFAYTDTGELAIHVHRMNAGTDRRHFWHEVTHLGAALVPAKRRKWREEEMAAFVELVVPYVLEHNAWVREWGEEGPRCPGE